MNEVIDFLKKENTNTLSKILPPKRKVIIQKDLNNKINKAIENEKKSEQKRKEFNESGIKTKVKPLKEIKKNKDVVWL